MMKSDYIVFIGRFQPFTNAHEAIVKEALTRAKMVVIVIGSYRATPTVKNPWNYEDRKNMILGSFSHEDQERLTAIPLRDHMYSDTGWISELQNRVAMAVGDNESVQLIGHFKDDSSYYLKFFPQWNLIEQPAYKISGITLDATDVRNRMWEHPDPKHLNNTLDYISDKVPENVLEYIEGYMRGWEKDPYEDRVKEYEYLINYRKSWESSPYPPTFVTTDTVVVQSGHVLLVKRGANPGKGLWALPGGFVNGNEPVIQSALRELKEETKIDLPKTTLKKSIKESHVFDHPQRSMRGRTITHAYLLELDNLRPLPKVKGGDDASHAEWMSFNDVIMNEDKFFEDHIHIVDFFLRNVGR